MRVGEGEDRRADTERAPPRNTYAYIAMQKSIGKGIKTQRPKTKTEKNPQGNGWKLKKFWFQKIH